MGALSSGVGVDCFGPHTSHRVDRRGTTVPGYRGPSTGSRNSEADLYHRNEILLLFVETSTPLSFPLYEGKWPKRLPRGLQKLHLLTVFLNRLQKIFSCWLNILGLSLQIMSFLLYQHRTSVANSALMQNSCWYTCELRDKLGRKSNTVSSHFQQLFVVNQNRTIGTRTG